MCPQTGRTQVTGHRSEIGPPDGKLEEVHDDESKFE